MRQPLLELSKEGVTFGLCLCVEGHEAKALAARWQRERDTRCLRPLLEGAWLDLDKEHRLVHEERVVCIREGRRRGHPQQLGDRAGRVAGIRLHVEENQGTADLCSVQGVRNEQVESPPRGF